MTSKRLCEKSLGVTYQSQRTPRKNKSKHWLIYLSTHHCKRLCDALRVVNPGFHFPGSETPGSHSQDLFVGVFPSRCSYKASPSPQTSGQVREDCGLQSASA